MNKKMNLYDFVTFTHKDYDTYDTDYEACVTVCDICYDTEDNYDKFCIELMKCVDVVDFCGDMLVVNWSDFIEKNIYEFRRFTMENWKENCWYKDDDEEFIYQWIRELHYYLAGYTDEDMYGELVEMIKRIKDK